MSEPIVVHTFKLLDKTTGRDRVCRLVQYSAKLVAWLLEEDTAAVLAAQRAKTLESFLSLARKLFRLGKSLDMLRVALHTLHLANPVHRLLITFSKINRGLYLLFDHVVWAAKLKLITTDTAKWSRIASRFWAISVLLGLLRDIYDLLAAIKMEQSRTTAQDRNTRSRRSLSSALSRTVVNHPAVVLDLVKNSTDIFIPLSNLKVVNMSSGAVGLMGVVSSLCGLIALWNDSFKLQYS